MTAIAAESLPLGRFLTLGGFFPAAVQRDFRWGKREFRALIDDLCRAFVEAGLDPEGDASDASEEVSSDDQAAPRRLPDYYLGSIVLMETAPGEFAIFDGQQRITSCTALLCVLRDVCVDPELKAAADDCVHDAEGRGRLTLDLRDHALRYDVQRPGATRTRWRQEDKDSLSDAGLRLRAAVTLFRSEIEGRGGEHKKGWSSERISAFLRFLLDKATVVLIRVQNERLANLAFETTNFRGLRLDEADALKSQIIDAIGAGGEEQETAGALWLDLQREFGVREFERFLTAVDFLERRAWQGPTKFADLFEHLKTKHGSHLAKWVRRALAAYAQAYRPLIQHETIVKTKGADLHLRRLSLLPWREWMAVALRQRSLLPEAAWPDALRNLEAASFAIMCAGYSSYDRAKIYRRALWQMERRRDPFEPGGAFNFSPEALVKMEEFLTGPIDEDDKEMLHATVRWLEALHWGDVLSPAPLEPELSVEHVLPLRPDALWTNDFPDRARRERLARLTGNLCLLPAADNEQRAGNRSFREKRPILQKAGHRLYMARAIAAHERWRPDVIEARTEDLRAKAWAAMSLPPRLPPSATDPLAETSSFLQATSTG